MVEEAVSSPNLTEACLEVLRALVSDMSYHPMKREGLKDVFDVSYPPGKQKLGNYKEMIELEKKLKGYEYDDGKKFISSLSEVDVADVYGRFCGRFGPKVGLILQRLVTERVEYDAIYPTPARRRGVRPRVSMRDTERVKARKRRCRGIGRQTRSSTSPLDSSS